jgi:hypothetical protein
MRICEVLDKSTQNVDEGIRQNAAVAALIAALSSTPVQANPEYSNQQDSTVAQKALTIFRTITNMKNYGQAGLESEARQEFNNLLQSIQGHPNQSKLYPVIKDIMKNQDTENLPPLQEPTNES